MTDRKAKWRRLERAGYVALQGWVPAAYAEFANIVIQSHREEVERIANQPPMPNGRPRKVKDTEVSK